MEEINTAILIFTCAISVANLTLIVIYNEYRLKRKETMFNVSAKIMDLLSNVISYSHFEGIPTKYRKLSLRIHMCFREGTAPEPLNTCLEEGYQLMQKRDTLSNQSDIDIWKKEVRDLAKKLRKELSGYCGSFK